MVKLRKPQTLELLTECYCVARKKPIRHDKVRLSLHMSLVAHQARAYPSFSSRLGVFLLPPGWDASPSQGYPQHQIRRYPFIHLGGERHYCESEVSCPRTQHNVPGQGSNPERSLRSRAH